MKFLNHESLELHGITVRQSIVGVRNLCTFRVSFLIVTVCSTVLFRNWYPFTYSHLAYAHFAYFRPKYGVLPNDNYLGIVVMSR